MTQSSANTSLISNGNQQHVKNGYKYDRRVTAMMVEDMLFNPILAARVLLDVNLPPHQELRVLMMWGTHFTLDDSGFSTGKSFTYAVVSALRALLLAGRIGGILSGTFRQGKLIFAHFDKWAARSKIFRNCIKIAGGKARLVHGQDAWEAHFRGTSTIRVLPPNFLQDSERLRSEKWNDGYFDEWTTFGNFRAFTQTIIGRVTAANPYPDCQVRQNHIHLSSTPTFVHHPSYRIAKTIEHNISNGNQNYAHFTSNYRHVPKTPKWAALVNRKVIFSMQTMNPRGVVESEVDGLWTRDSLSYYSSTLLDDQALRQSIYMLLRRRMVDDVYLAAFDSARGQESQKKAGGDDFALSVLRIPKGRTKAEYCFCIRRNNVTAEDMAGIVQDYNQRFHFTMILYDPNGGGLFVRDELRKSELIIRGEKQAVYPIIEMGDMSGTLGDMILIPIRRSTIHIQQVWGKMTSDSVLVNRIHKNMRTLLETYGIVLPPPWQGWEQIGYASTKWELDEMRRLLDQRIGLNESDRAWAETDLAIRQLISVDVERNEAGEPTVDSHGMHKFKSKQKKDAAYSLIYVALAKLLYDNLGDQFGDSNGSNEDTGYIASSSIVNL